MVGNNPHGYIFHGVLTVISPAHLGDIIDYREDQIRIIVALYLLNNACYPLKPHTGINAGLGERVKNTVGIAVKLHKDKIPEFQMAVAVTVGVAIRSAAAGARSLIYMYLAARSAGSGFPHLPEIILLAPPKDLFFAESDPAPEIKSLVVVFIYGYEEFIRRQLQLFGEKVPSEADRLLLKIIPEREVAEHFKECMLAGSPPHIFKIVVFAARSDYLLAGCGTGIRALRFAQKGILKLVHPCVGKEKGRIVMGNQRG
jgi:hypothetical protein